jgi:hypothetical protein
MNVTRLVTVLMAIAMGTPAALALSEWWTPPNATCPTFDSEEACEAYCRADDKRCGGEAECTWRTGEKRPEC